MRRARRAVALALAMMLFFPSLRADARTPLDTETIIAGAIAGGLDLALTTVDLVMAGRGIKPSSRYAGIELTLMTIQLTLGISLLASISNAHAVVYDQLGNPTVLQNDTGLIIPIGILLTVAATGLGIHATLALRRADPAQHASLSLVPGVSASSQQVVFTLAGRF
jgi:hypothetical protein